MKEKKEKTFQKCVFFTNRANKQLADLMENLASTNSSAVIRHLINEAHKALMLTRQTKNSGPDDTPTPDP